MPYRRLPNTDTSRIKSLKCAIECNMLLLYSDRIISGETIETASVFLPAFENSYNDYKQNFQAQIRSNKSFQELVKNARLYISHFIQVLNLSVIRKEINADLKLLYGLEPNASNVPDLTSDNSILTWGEKIITGEKNRLSEGGTPLYNPTIAKVQVHYDMFRTAYIQQKMLQKSTAKALSKLSSLRIKADKIICEIWNQVEKKYADLDLEERLEKCSRYGVVYYYRKGEQKIGIPDEIN